MNYHTLSDFRTQHGELLDRLLTDSVAVLMHEGLVTLERVAQDGMKVRASAGASSFRRRPTLEECARQAEEHLRELREELDQNPAAATARQRAARERVARERLERVQRALEQLPQVEAAKKPKDREKARVSTTDPEARVMKGGDGGFRPSYNVQFATDTATHVITGVEVTNSGGDFGHLLPMMEQHEERYEKRPNEALLDGGYAKKEDIEQLAVGSETAPAGTKVYSPVMESKDPNRDSHTPRPDDSPAVAEWRQRMATPEAKEIYKQRASTAECTNAQSRNRGFYRVLVRGVAKVKSLALWHALAVNFRRTVTLRAERELAPATG
jgi:IS5 family transposase